MYIIAQAPASAVVSVAAAASATINAFQVIAGEPGAGSQNNLNAPGSNRLNGLPFTVRAAGFVTLAAFTSTSGATPLNFVLYGSNTASFAAATGNALWTASVAAFTFASATAKTVPFEIEVELQGDSTSATVIGVAEGVVQDPNGLITAVARTKTAQAPTTLNFLTEPPMQFAAALTMGTSANLGIVTAQLTQFIIEA
jgi:hypothetical protein